MSRFQSFLTTLMEAFIAFQKASGRWNETYEHNLFLFDSYCTQPFPEAEALTQEIVTVGAQQWRQIPTTISRIKWKVAK
jgi:hypothetical protein